MERLGNLYKEAANWREIQRDLSVIIQLSNLPVNELCRRSGISDTHLRRLLESPERMKPKHFSALFRSIVEVDNFERVKQQSDG